METYSPPSESRIKRSLFWDKLYYTPFSISLPSDKPLQTLIDQATDRAKEGNVRRTIQLSRTILKKHHEPSTLQSVSEIMATVMKTRADKYSALATQEFARRGLDWFKGQIDGADYEVMSDHAGRRQAVWESYLPSQAVPSFQEVR